MEIFSGRIIDVGHQALRVLRLRGPVEAFEKAFQFAPPMPAHNGRGNFIANGVTEDCRMAGAGAHFGAHHLLNRAGALAVIQKSHRAFHRQSCHDPQPVPLRRIQQPERGRRVRAHRVHASGRHPGEVPVDCFQRGELFALLIGTKRAVGDPAEVKFFMANEKEFALDPGRTVRSGTLPFDST